MALTAAATRTLESLDLVRHRPITVVTPIALWEGGFYSINTTTGALMLPTNGAGERGAGIAFRDYAINERVVLEYGHIERLPLTVAVGDVGAAVYATSDNVFTLTPGAATARVGWVHAFVTTAIADVVIWPLV